MIIVIIRSPIPEDPRQLCKANTLAYNGVTAKLEVILRRCLVANRGEIALRIIRACHELGMEAVAVYSPADIGAEHVLQADRSFALTGDTAAGSYLDSASLIDIAQAASCDCLHPGYGFLSESYAFAREVEASGLCWVGPRWQAMRTMGNKTAALAALADTEVPTLPRFAPEYEASAAEYAEQAARIGYPVMVKAASGGGGRGIRVVETAVELSDALVTAKREAERSFSDARLYLEHFLRGARHIEVQIAADAFGQIIHLYERDCSLQRRQQKIVEVAPASGIMAEQRQALCQAAMQVVKTVPYDNVGTVEFLLADDGAFYFLEMNTRLQVEHALTELVCGVDLVRLQFLLARGEELPYSQEDIRPRGHALQCRIYAENPREGFRPATGFIAQYCGPTGVGIRWDSALREGLAITPHYDSLLAKLVVLDETRAASLSRMRCALRDVVLLGVETNLEFLMDLLALPQIENGHLDTGFVERVLPDLLVRENGDLPNAVRIAATLGEPEMTTSVTKKQRSSSPWEQADRFRVGPGIS